VPDFRETDQHGGIAATMIRDEVDVRMRREHGVAAVEVHLQHQRLAVLPEAGEYLSPGPQLAASGGVELPEERMQRHREPDIVPPVEDLPRGGDAAQSDHLQELLAHRKGVLDSSRTTDLDARHDCHLGDGVAGTARQLPSPAAKLLACKALSGLSPINIRRRWLVLLDRNGTEAVSGCSGEPGDREAAARDDVGWITSHPVCARNYLKSSETE